MTEIKTLSEMPECCAICEMMSSMPWICSIGYDYVHVGNWCEYFSAKGRLKNKSIAIVKPMIKDDIDEG